MSGDTQHRKTHGRVRTKSSRKFLRRGEGKGGEGERNGEDEHPQKTGGKSVLPVY